MWPTSGYVCASGRRVRGILHPAVGRNGRLRSQVHRARDVVVADRHDPYGDGANARDSGAEPLIFLAATKVPVAEAPERLRHRKEVRRVPKGCRRVVPMSARLRGTTAAHRADTVGTGFTAALERARGGDIDLESALSLLRGAERVERARELFVEASKIRDRALGREVGLTAHLHMVTRCELDPPCRYCSLSSAIPAVRDERAKLSQRALSRTVRYVVERGIRSIVLVGGSDLAGSDAAVRRAVETVREVSDLPLAVDVGPSLSPETVEWLKGRDARTIYCSIETANAEAFRRAKPGDDLETRIAFNTMLEDHGMTLGNVVMNGLGSATDLLRSVLFLRRFRRLSYLHISTFHPVPGTPWAGRRPASVQRSLRVLAIARFVFPTVHLGLAEVEVEAPGGGARVRAQLRAGGGNTFAAILVYRNRTVDNLEQIAEETSEEGFIAA